MLSNTPDVQVYNTSFVYKGKKKEVFFFENECPKDYQDLIKYLINLKSNQVSKIDTVLNFETRLRIPFEKEKIYHLYLTIH